MLRTLIARLARARALGFAVGARHKPSRSRFLGPMAFVQGEHHWNGAEMARDEINKAGGVNVGGKRMRIELVAPIPTRSSRCPTPPTQSSA
jgi:branched-chain amino acid transport system substrate-binding protein